MLRDLFTNNTCEYITLTFKIITLLFNSIANYYAYGIINLDLI